MISNDVQNSAHVALLEAASIDHFGHSVRSSEIDLRIAIANHMNMRRIMIVRIYDEAKPGLAMHRYHKRNNLYGWVIQYCSSSGYTLAAGNGRGFPSPLRRQGPV